MNNPYTTTPPIKEALRADKGKGCQQGLTKVDLINYLWTADHKDE